ncbi:FecR family protein [Desulfonema ishimotonii]|uniref:FecR family protein n=1 Tax=Desulfonema ishimotonii TaxID=45657 RepID=UPI00140B89CD|nr:FecR domain-containing protein [Desulfonema ishimotonii]
MGKITSVEGRADITSPGDAARTATAGDTLSIGDIVRTKSNAKADIEFIDGSILRLGESARVEIAEYLFENGQTRARLRLFRGKIQNIVNKARGLFGHSSPNRFEVQTPTAIIGVRGTRFFTYHQAGISGAMFMEGKGYCYSLSRPDRIAAIIAGQAMTVANARTPPVLRPISAMEIQRNLRETTPQNGSDKKNRKNPDEVAPLTSSEPVEKDAPHTDGEKAPPADASQAMQSDEVGNSVTKSPAGENSSSEFQGLPAEYGWSEISYGGEDGPDSEAAESEFYANDELRADGPFGEGDIFGFDESDEERPMQGQNTLTQDGFLASETGEEGEYWSEADFEFNMRILFAAETDEEQPIGKEKTSAVTGVEGEAADMYTMETDDVWSDVYHTDMAGEPDQAEAEPLLRYGDQTEIGKDNTADDIEIPISETVPTVVVEQEFQSNVSAQLFTGVFSEETDTCQIIESGVMTGIFSGEDSLWRADPASPASASLTGGYQEITRTDTPSLWVADELSGFNYINNTRTTFDGGAYTGFLGGIRYNDLLIGTALALCTDPRGNVGILKGQTEWGGFDEESGQFAAEFELFPVRMGQDWGIPPEYFEDALLTGETRWHREEDTSVSQGRFIDGSGALAGRITVDDLYQEVMSIQGASWAISMLASSGTYDEDDDQVFGQWQMALSDPTDTRKWLRGFFSNTAGAENAIAGETWSAWININSALTGVGGGDFTGTYDPDQHTWQMVELFSTVETGKFIRMASGETGRQQLADLNIPAFEIGRTTLSGQSDTMSVEMRDVAFFSYRTGDAPRIWATDSVSGNFLATPETGHTVSLSGNGLTAEFSVTDWNAGTWAADVQGSGALNRNDTGGTVSAQFSGYAAGQHTGGLSGSFEGTASGLATAE